MTAKKEVFYKYVNKQPVKEWKTSTGQKIPLDKMTDEHLRNSKAFLEKKGWTNGPSYAGIVDEIAKRKKNSTSVSFKTTKRACPHCMVELKPIGTSVFYESTATKEMVEAPDEIAFYCDACSNVLVVRVGLSQRDLFPPNTKEMVF